MAWRAIQDSVGQSESLAELSDLAERIYWRLLAHSDPWGRLDSRPRKLRARCYPMLGHSDEQAGYALLELEGVERIIVYERAGEYVLQIVDFEANQPREAFRKRSGKPRLPDPPASRSPAAAPSPSLIAHLFHLHSAHRLFPGLSGSPPENSPTISGGDPEQDRRRTDGEGEQTEKEINTTPGRQATSGVDQAGLPAGSERTEDEPELAPEPRLGAISESVRVELGRLRSAEARA